MNTLEFFAHGHPKAQPRARATIRGKHAGIYNPGTADDWKATIREAAREATRGYSWTIFLGAVRLDATFFFQRPKAHFRGKSGALRLDAPVYHTSKPDRDNLDKALLDALKNVQVFRDDCQVAAGTITKLYGMPGQPVGVRVHIVRLQDTQ